MALRIAINGFGRIGRLVYKVAYKRPDVEFVAINDITDSKTLAHLLKYDSIHGQFPDTVTYDGPDLVVAGKKLPISAIKDPAQLPWSSLGVDVVIESTGKFTSMADLKKHLDAGAKKVLLTVPAKDEIDAMIVMGVNEEMLKPEHKVVSNASCTTNCLAPVAKVLHDNFGIVKGWMTTIHSYTNDQQVLDLPHKDLRRARAAALSMIPTTTGAAKAVGKIIPSLKGKLDGISIRVPTPDGSLVDLVCELDRDVTVEEINTAMKNAAKGAMSRYLEYTDDPIVSCDVVGNPHSSVFDGLSTMVMDKRFVKVLAWYDNEWGYSNRVVDLMMKLK